MSHEDRAAIVAKIGTVATIEGRALSIHNACLLFTQRPDVSIVGGYRQWQRAGRQVRKGETGCAIWRPVKRKRAETDNGRNGDEDNRPGFILITVFDIAQTDETAAA
jgi:antirestriction protein ArdC